MGVLGLDIERSGPRVTASLTPSGGGGVQLDPVGLGELVSGLEEAVRGDDVGCVVIRCRGDDRRLLGASLADYDRLATREQALTFAARGASALDRLAKLSPRTVAVIEEAWWAEAFELALACDVRVAAPEARVGLPQPRLGHVPGWGGVVRLTRRIGPARALWTLALAAGFPAEAARRLGLVDEVRELSPNGEDLIRVSSRGARWPAFDRMLAWLPPLRRMALSRPVAGAKARSPARERLPRLVELAIAWPKAEALDQEREAFADTVCSPEARAARAAVSGGDGADSLNGREVGRRGPSG